MSLLPSPKSRFADNRRRRSGLFASGLAACALAAPAAAQFSFPFELSGVDASNGMILRGIDALDFAGKQVANAGDINGDGVDDLLIAAPYADPNGNSSGEVYVVFGSSAAGKGLAGDPLDGSGNLNLSSLNGTNGFTIVGVSASHRSGAGIAGVGDVNGDGLKDIAIGTVYADPLGRTDAGRVTVVFGNTEFGLGSTGDPLSGGSILSLGSVTGSKGFHIAGASAYDQLGTAIDGAGDVNGDGIDDIVVGAFLSSPNGVASGQAWVVFGNTKLSTGQAGDPVSLGTFDLNGVDGDDGFRMPGGAERDYAGTSVAGAGDIDGDGAMDIIVGAPQADPASAGSNRGTSYVVFGTNKFGTGLSGDPLGGGSSLSLTSLNGTYGFQINGVTNSDKTGARVSPAGDFNGDGIADFMVGAPDGDNLAILGQREGLVYFIKGNDKFGTGLSGDPLVSGVLNLSTLNGTHGFHVRGSNPVDQTGYAMRGGADFNLDGRSDLLFGAPDADPNSFSSGTAYVIYGATTLPGASGLLNASDINGTNGTKFNGIFGSVSGGDRAGMSVVAGGDFNGDGGKDVVVASPEANLGGSGRQGRIHVVYGTKPADATPPTVAKATTNKPNGSYRAGEQIEIRIVFSEPVVVNTAGGTPTVTLDTSGVATYIDGSGSKVLRFSYTVAAGQNSADLNATSMALGGSTIRDGSDNNATLTLPGGSNSLAGGHAIVVDTIAPTIARFQSDTPAGTYGAGETVDIDAVFSESLYIGAGAGTPTVTLDSGGTGTWTGTSGTTTISFNYTILAGHASADLDVTAISTAGRTFADLAGNVANLALPSAPNRLRDHEAIALDSQGPILSTVTSAKPDGHYPAGTVVDIDLVFDDDLVVDFDGGNPRISINTGDTVFYHSMPDVRTLRFRYTASSMDNAADLDVLAFNLNGCAISDASGNAATVALPTGASSLAGHKDIAIDTVRPTIASFGSPTPDGTYGTSVAIEIDANFSEEIVLASGSPRLSLSNGALALHSSTVDGDTLRFTYNPAMGDDTPELDVSSFSLNGATIRDLATNTLLATPLPTGPNSLAGAKDIAIETVSPNLVSITSSAPNGFYSVGAVVPVLLSFDESVVVTNGVPALAMDSGGTATYTSGSGSSTLAFSYTVGAGENSADLDVAAYFHNDASVRDAVGNEAVIDLPGGANSLAGSKSIVVDTDVPTILSVGTTAVDGSYTVGAVIPVTLAFDEPVTVATGGGTPSIALSGGGSAIYSSGSGTATLTFVYTVAAGQNAADLDTLSVAGNGGTIRDTTLNDFDPTLPATTLADIRNIEIDTIAPSIASLTSVPATENYRAGESLDIAAALTEPVFYTAATAPTLSLDSGGSAVLASFPTTSSILFHYDVLAGHNSADLNAVALALNGSTVVDDAGNALSLVLPGGANSLAGGQNIAIDTTAPAPTISSPDVAHGATIAGPPTLSFSVAFADALAVTGFDPTNALDFSYSNATLGSVSNVGNTWSFSVSPTADGPVSLQVLAAAATDAAGNASVASAAFDFTFDTNVPSSALLSGAVASGGYTNASSLPFTARFFASAPPMSGFVSTDSGDLSVANGTAGSATQSGDDWNFNLSTTVDGAVSLQILAGAAQDSLARGNSASPAFSFTRDTVAPTVAISSVDVAHGATVAAPASFAFQIAFSDATPILGFDPSGAPDLVVSGANVVVGTRTGNTWPLTVTPTGNGTVSLSVPAGAATDSALNSNPGPASFSFVYDTVAPTASLSSIHVADGASANAPSVFAFVATFADATAVSGFDPTNPADLSVSGATISNVVPSGNSVAFDATPSGQGTVALQILAAAATDAAGNTNTASAVFDFVYDTTAPAPTLASVDVANGATVGSPASFVFTATFADALAVSGFDPANAADLSISGATASSATRIGNTWTFTATPTGNGPVALQVLAGAATDAAGNASAASNSFAFVYDATPPTVALSSVDVAHGATVDSPASFAFAAVFADTTAVSGFDPQNPSDLAVSGATASVASQAGNTFTFAVTPTGDGPVSLQVLANAAVDAVGHPNVASSTFAFVYDATAPTAALSSVDATHGTTVGSPASFSFTAAFSDTTAVSGFDPQNPADLSISGASASAASQSGNEYTFVATPSGDGPIALQVLAGAAVDAAGNASLASNAFAFVYDATAPTVVLSSLDVVDGATVASPASFSFSATFSDATTVSGFDPQNPADLAISGATASAASFAANAWTFSVVPTGDGPVSLQVLAGAAADAAGNASAASNSYSFVFDSAAPTVVLSSANVAAGATVRTPSSFAFSAAFSDGTAISGFDPQNPADFSISGATVSAASQVGNTYNFSVVPTGDGPVSLQVLGAAAADAAGNASVASNAFSFVYDTTAPAASLSSADVANGATINSPPVLDFVASFVDATAVSGFDPQTADLVVTGPATIGGTSTSFTVTPTDNGTITLQIAAGAAVDAAGNPSAASATFSFTYSTLGPPVSLSSIDAANGATISSPSQLVFTASFGGPLFVDGFDAASASDVEISGATATSTARLGNDFFFVVEPTGDGAVTLRVRANAAQDTLGNGNSASAPFSFVYDTTPPVVEIISSSLLDGETCPCQPPIRFEIAVNDLTDVAFDLATDVVVTNGTASAAKIGGASYLFDVAPSSPGLVTVEVPAGALVDEAGHVNAAASFSFFWQDPDASAVRDWKLLND